MRVLISIVACSLIALPALADGRKIKVPKDYPNIQTAINFAEDADTVIVDDGVWTGPGNKNLDFLGLAITVRSKNGPDNCIIDCEGEGRAFNFLRNETPESAVKGFTITGADDSGIHCEDSSPTITDCTIEGNTADYSGGGIYCIGGRSTITNCMITGNTARGGGGICGFNSRLTITNCTIVGNMASMYGGGGISCYDGIIANCTITGNMADGGGGGISGSGGTPTITNCTITGNKAGGGGGISCGFLSKITNCTIVGNTASMYGGGGISCNGAIITNCTIAANTANEGGGGISCSGTPPITNCILWGDTPDEIYVKGGNPVVTYCDIQGGWPGTHNIDADPRFVTGPLGDYYLSHKRAGQDKNSPCRNAGDGTAKELGLKKTTTRTDGKKDKRAVDMGYHYPR